MQHSMSLAILLISIGSLSLAAPPLAPPTSQHGSSPNDPLLLIAENHLNVTPLGWGPRPPPQPPLNCFLPAEYPHVPYQDCLNTRRLLPHPITPGERKTFSADPLDNRYKLPTGATYNSCNVTVELVDVSRSVASSWDAVKRTIVDIILTYAEEGHLNGGTGLLGRGNGIRVKMRRVNTP